MQTSLVALQLLVLPALTAALAAPHFQGWSIGEFPNPRYQFNECGMRSYARVCDPDLLIGEQDRYRLNTGLANMQRRSEGTAGTFCEKKGLEGVLAVLDRADQSFADGLYQKWDGIDTQCNRAVVVVLSRDTRRIFVSGHKEAGIDDKKIAGILADQEPELRDGLHVHAIEGVFQRLAAAAKPVVKEVPANQRPTPKFNFMNAGTQLSALPLYAFVSLLSALFLLLA